MANPKFRISIRTILLLTLFVASCFAFAMILRHQETNQSHWLTAYVVTLLLLPFLSGVLLGMSLGLDYSRSWAAVLTGAFSALFVFFVVFLIFAVIPVVPGHKPIVVP